MENVQEPRCLCSKTAPSFEENACWKPFQFQLLESRTCRNRCACAAKQLLALRRVRVANPRSLSC
eukprot:10707755-Karenia_brevis.AAC.1